MDIMYLMKEQGEIKKETKSINIYMDESSIDNPDRPYMVIGGVFVAREAVPKLRKDIKAMLDKNNFYEEIKWTKTNTRKLSILKDVAKYVLDLPAGTISFHCIVIKKDEIDTEKYHNSDKELAFFKFMYTLLSKRMDNFIKYYIFPDQRPTPNERLHKLREFLERYIYFNLSGSSVEKLQSYSSKENLFIQLADLFSGAIAYHYANFSDANPEGDTSAKNELALYIAENIGRGNLRTQTAKTEKKFNIFRIRWNNGNNV